MALHCECAPSGTARLAAKKKYRFHLANDDSLDVVGKYSVTSTYLIDKQGIIRGRWLGRIHKRVGASEILTAARKLNDGDATDE